MPETPRQIIAIGGGGFYRDAENLALEKYVTQQTGVESPRLAALRQAIGLAPEDFATTSMPVPTQAFFRNLQFRWPIARIVTAWPP